MCHPHGPRSFSSTFGSPEASAEFAGISLTNIRPLCLFVLHINPSSMPILQVFLVIIVVGVLLWLVNRFIPMQGTIKWILNLLVVIVLIVWLLKVFGVWGSVAGAHV